MRKFQQFLQFFRGQTPGQLVIQLTERCNATCPQCEMRVSNRYARPTLDLNVCEALIEQARKTNIQAISFTGGEPLLYLDRIKTLVTRATAAGITLTRTGTNGFLFRDSDSPGFKDRVKNIAEQLAATRLRNFWISIDSADPTTHERLRGFPGVIRGIEKALPIFHANGLYPTANLGLNRYLGGQQPSRLTKGIRDEADLDEFKAHLKLGLCSFLNRVIDLGFTIVNFCYPMSIDNTSTMNPVYAAASPEHIVNFSSVEKEVLFATMLETIPRFRHAVRVFSPLSSIYILQQSYAQPAATSPITPFPCRGGLDYFFISAKDGKVYPCGYRGDECLGELKHSRTGCNETSNCTKCDWECFRDPSELISPLLYGLRSPKDLLTIYRRDKTYYRYWSRDLKYYRACGWFDGRQDLNERRLAKFRSPDN